MSFPLNDRIASRENAKAAAVLTSKLFDTSSGVISKNGLNIGCPALNTAARILYSGAENFSWTDIQVEDISSRE